jgi:putative alpha-1,2-mannosidase
MILSYLGDNTSYVLLSSNKKALDYSLEDYFASSVAKMSDESNGGN